MSSPVGQAPESLWPPHAVFSATTGLGRIRTVGALQSWKQFSLVLKDRGTRRMSLNSVWLANTWLFDLEQLKSPFCDSIFTSLEWV